MSKEKKRLTLEELLDEALLPAEEQPYEVPENWLWTKIGIIGVYHNGKVFKSTDWSTIGRPIIRIQDLTGTNKGKQNYFEGTVPAKHEIKKGDLLISWSATLGAYIWMGEDAVLNQHIFKVESFIDKHYHYYAVKNMISQLMDKTHGSGMVHVTKKVFDEASIPLPPLAEQKRIVDKIESLLSKIDEAKQLIKEAMETFELRRAAILDKAFSGQLTAKWSEKQTQYVQSDELLQLIRERKNVIYEQLCSSSIKRGIKKPSSPKFYNSEIERNSLVELPANWKYCTLGEVIYDFKYGSSSKSDYNNSGSPVIRIPNVGEQYLELGDIKYLTDEVLKDEVTVVKGDLLIIRSNGSKDLVGKCAIVNEEAEGFVFASYLIRMRPVLVLPEYLYWLLKSDKVRGQFFSKSKSSAGINNINTQELASTVIPLPPLEEQREIVRVIGKLNMSEQYIKNILDLEKQLDQLSQSVLMKAFKGELGTNDSSDESAVELLKEVLS